MQAVSKRFRTRSCRAVTRSPSPNARALPPRATRSWALGDVDQPESSPPDAGEPRPRCHHRRRAADAYRGRPPASEPRRGRQWVDPAHAGNVLPHVLQNVDDRQTHFARRSKLPRMVPVRPDGSTPAKCSVEPSRDAYGQPLQSPTQTSFVVSLHDQVKVVVLNAEMQKPERRGRSGGKGRAHGGEGVWRAQRRKPGTRSHGHVHRRAGVVCLAAVMRHALASRGAPPSCASSRSAPGRTRFELQLLHAACQLDWAEYISSMLACQLGERREAGGVRAGRPWGGAEAGWSSRVIPTRRRGRRRARRTIVGCSPASVIVDDSACHPRATAKL